MAPIIKQLRDELLEQITASTTPMGRLRSTLDTHISVRYIQEQKTRAIEEILDALKARKNTSANELKSWATLVESSKMKVQDTSALLEHNPAERGKSSIDRTPLVPNFSTFRHPQEDRETLFSLMRSYRRLLSNMHMNVPNDTCPPLYWQRVRSALRPPKECAIQDILDDKFGPVWQKLNDYWFDTYLLSSSFQEDHALVVEAIDAALSGLIALWRRQWHKALVDGEQAFRLELKQFERARVLHEEEYQQAERQHAVIEQDILELGERLDLIVQNSKDDLERCERFVNLLEEEYSAALDQQYANALAQLDPTDALLELLSCAALSHQYHEFLALNQREAG
jgi:hypothetical protein